MESLYVFIRCVGESCEDSQGLIVGLSLACCFFTKLLIEIIYMEIMCGEFMGGVWFNKHWTK